MDTILPDDSDKQPADFVQTLYTLEDGLAVYAAAAIRLQAPLRVASLAESRQMRGAMRRCFDSLGLKVRGE